MLRESRRHMRAWAEIDVPAFVRNIHLLQRFAGNRLFMAVVKANAYGHGAVPMARAALGAGATFLGVANVLEGVELRESGIVAPIVVLAALPPDQVEAAVEYALQFFPASEECLELASRAAVRQGRDAQLHLMVDTGMTRHGLSAKETLRLSRLACSMPGVEIAGFATHFVAAESNDLSSSRRQLKHFQKVIKALRRAGTTPKYVHTANSAAVIQLPEAHFNLVRPGAALYGIYPSRHIESVATLEQVMTVRSRIISVREVERGTPVGYGSTERTTRRTRLALIPVGYADGWPVALSGHAYVLVHGLRARVVGRISMDCMVADVGHIPDVKSGDIATLLGRDGDDILSIGELADWSGRIPYEVTCAVGHRITRIYKNEPGEVRWKASNGLPGSTGARSPSRPLP